MQSLAIKHFKCFDNINVPLNRLTVLAGANGFGKSTVIQSILFLRCSIEECGNIKKGKYFIKKEIDHKIPLNGKYCLQLGNSNLVLSRNYNGDEISLGFTNGSYVLQYDYYADNKKPLLWLTTKNIIKSADEKNQLTMQEFYYLNAERIGPRINQQLQLTDFPNAGCKGEYIAQLVGLENGYYKIEKERRFQNKDSQYLEKQINNWLNYIMPGIRVKAENNPKSFTAQILLDNEYTNAEFTLATNLGFGVSYILPIIATGLIAKKDSLFIVENPEAHLHPSAQSKIGRFLAMVASSGVNVIIETHSDHIINGIQIAVAKNEINNSLLTINYFGNKEGNVQPEIQSISVSELGELAAWPKGFFDQTQVDFAELIKSRKK